MKEEAYFPGNNSQPRADVATLAVILRGPQPSLDKALRMLKGFADIDVIYTKRSKGKLWIISERRQHKNRSYESEEEGDVYIGGEIYPRQEIERIASEWQRDYIIA